MRSLVVLFAVFTAATAVSVFEEFLSFNGNHSNLALSDRNCKCVNGRCVTDNRGITKCACRNGYALQDDQTCEVCDCGTKGKCFFSLKRLPSGSSAYEKKCLCDKGYAPKDGVCIECVCGENSKCEFEGDEKICYCIDGYSERFGVCTECNCGDFGECKFNGGNKECTCDQNYLVNNGICEECNCGIYGSCSFQNGRKTCSCNTGYKVKNGKCEKCDCGYYSTDCRFDDQTKVCQCKNGYAQRYATCEACGCGQHSTGCRFTGDKKHCNCERGYVQKGAQCEVGCGVYENCKNGGQCDGGFCRCPPGTRGEFCEVIDECTNNLCPNQRDTVCSYDVPNQKAYCQCLNKDLSYDVATKTCKKTCSDDYWRCENGGVCVRSGDFKFCRCLDGTSGDMCEVVDDCANGRLSCGNDAKCVFDLSKLKAVCKCIDPQKSFNSRLKQCRRTCDETIRCKNGGECTTVDDYDFCKCPPGTSGDHCEIVDDCARGLCGFDKSVKCTYDPVRKAGQCGCWDASLKYDPTSKMCKACDCGRRAIACEFVNSQKVCTCPTGFTEMNGRCTKIKCVENKCTNGKCNIGPDGEQEICKCFEGFVLEGDFCRRVDCKTTVCNMGICVVRYGNVEECLCPAGHMLLGDACIRGQCTRETCYGGQCKTVQGERMCICPPGYHLQGIGCFATVCEKRRCFGGVCHVSENKEICTCPAEHTLVDDVCKRVLCQKKNCFGGVCTIQNGEELCTCPPGYTLHDDVCYLGG